MKRLGKLLGLSAIALLSAAFVGCGNIADVPNEISVETVKFSPAEDRVYAPGTSVTLYTENESLDIYASVDVELTADNYSDETIAKQTNKIVIEKSCTVYAIAVDQIGNCSAVTKHEYQVGGPSNVSFNVDLLANDDGDVYAGAKVTVSSDEAEKIYWSTEKVLSFKNFKTEGNLYVVGETPLVIDLGTKLNEEVTVYAVAVSSDGLNSKVFSKKYKTVARYLPLEGSVADDVESGNYELEGNVKAVLDKIGSSEIDVDLDETIVSGYVTMTLSQGVGGVVIQDKNGAIEIYGAAIAYSDRYVGEFVSVKAKKGKMYRTTPEITEFDVLEKGENEDTTVLYYRNLNNKNDFSGLTGMVLCGVKMSASEYKFDKNCALITMKNVDDKAVFGYVTYYSNANHANDTLRLQIVYTKDESVATDAPSTVKNSVEKVYLSSENLQPSEKLALYCVTPGATIHYTLDGSMASSASAVYSEPIELTKMGSYKVSVYAEKDGYENAYSASYAVTLLSANTVIIPASKFNGQGANAEMDEKYEFDDVTVSIAKGEGGNSPKAYSDAIRVYGKNTITVSSKKIIESIEFTAVRGYAFTAATADNGIFDISTQKWSGLSDSVTITNTGKQFRFTEMVVTFSEVSLYDSEVIFGLEEGVVLEKGTELVLSTTETDADIYYSTTDALIPGNAIAKGTKYVSPIVLNDTTTVYAILVSNDGTKYSSGKSATFAVSAAGMYADLTTELTAGKKVYFYSAKNSKVMTFENGAISSKDAATFNNGTKLAKDDSALLFTIEEKEGGISFKTEDGKYLTVTKVTTTSNGSEKTTYGLVLSDFNETDSVYTATQVSGKNTFFIANDTAQIEFYNKWTSYKSGKTEAYEVTLFEAK